MVGSPDDLDTAVLRALVEGFRARAGAKERFQALSEYEIARRAGLIGCSYVEFDQSPEREPLRAVLARLQRQGLVRLTAVSGRYDTFAPTEQGEQLSTAHLPAPPGPTEVGSPLPGGGSPPTPTGPVAAGVERAGSAGDAERPLPTTFEGRLDEMIRLLRSIDERLRRIERS